MSSTIALGIDLGTTNICAAFVIKGSDGEPHIFKNFIGEYLMPSFVSFTPEYRYFWTEAKDECRANPGNTVFDAKRLIGRNFCHEEVQKLKSYLPFKIDADKDGRAIIVVRENDQDKPFRPEATSAMLLAKIKEDIKKLFPKGQNCQNGCHCYSSFQ
eukprot:Gregarina_sp_Poly_1__4230@NODE_2306_length_2324_cov_18_027913_g1477_i0_p1_GENE_NODE_2306_length_2324_cov_18_027913_g1477_i0NODE_2306_length_2324_cov_18_027913_g1477_i0_p1_ORF_typecomplete_len157_score25_08HSP70/PF00012_20/4_3e08_NODE_2306_length_2324_cov_18_027913_g1477_i0262732